jgi:hypothetical protein
MSQRRFVGLVVLALVPALVSAAPKPVEAPPRYVPKFDPVAETKLLMEGLAQPNFRGLEGLLKKEPADAEAWTFARGQALLLAETGNLLLLRPPRTASGQDTWFRLSTEFRKAATALARSAGAQDYARSRADLAEVADSCNRCHQTFRIAKRIGAPAREGGSP